MKRLFRYIILLWIGIFALPSTFVCAQDITNFTQFYFNPSLLNPSLTGSDGQPVLFIAYKKQWAGMEGSPGIANLNLQTDLGNQMNLGITLNNSKSGQINSSAALFTGAYALPLGTHQVLRFGLSAGISSTTVDVNSLTFATPNDPVLAGLVKTNLQLIGNFGVSFHSQTFHAGIALPTIFQPTYFNNNSFTVSKVSPFESIIVHASNRFYLAKGKNVFEPYVVYRLNSSLPSQFEVAGVFHIQNLVYVGAAYKQNFGISALGGFKINKLMALGYSYTIKNTGTNELNRPSHEIQFGYLFGKPVKHQKPVASYSFVNTEKEKIHKKTPQELAAEKRKHDAEVAKKAQEEKAALAAKQLEEKKKKEAELAAAAAAAKAAEKKPALDTAKKVSHVLSAEEQHKLEQEHLQRLETHADNPTEHHEGDVVHPNAERHEIVKRGGHKEELEVGDYVIAGVFRQRENAKKYSDGLIKLGFKDSDFGFLTTNNLWYVHIAETNDIEAARSFRDTFRKMKMFREAWLLTVQK